MSQINTVSGSAPIQPSQLRPVARPATAAPAGPTRGSDKLELSGASHLLKLSKANDVRTDKVADLKAQIAAGTYETDDKLTAAADQLLDDLFD